MTPENSRPETSHDEQRSSLPTAEQAAAEWFNRCNRGLTPKQEEEFERWLCASPENGRLFNELDKTWSLLSGADSAKLGLNPELEMAPAQLDQRFSERAANEGRSTRWQRNLLISGFGIAAAIMIVAYLRWWRPLNFSTDVSTEIGVVRTANLPDGSTVALNTDSDLEIVYTPTERKVRLGKGEAHFSVAKDPARPFTVDANGVSIRAVGTAFNVRLHSSALEVLVTEGKVRLLATAPAASAPQRAVAEETRGSAASSIPLLEAGRRAVVDLENSPGAPKPLVAVATVDADEVRRSLAWKKGLLDFVAAPLEQMAAEFNRYNRHKIVIADVALRSQQFGGTFNPSDYAGFVRMLRDNFGVVAEEKENETILRVP